LRIMRLERFGFRSGSVVAVRAKGRAAALRRGVEFDAASSQFSRIFPWAFHYSSVKYRNVPVEKGRRSSLLSSQIHGPSCGRDRSDPWKIILGSGFGSWEIRQIRPWRPKCDRSIYCMHCRTNRARGFLSNLGGEHDARNPVLAPWRPRNRLGSAAQSPDAPGWMTKARTPRGRSRGTGASER